jgi:D-sedoheptulose 7-phosphate isomerase
MTGTAHQADMLVEARQHLTNTAAVLQLLDLDCLDRMAAALHGTLKVRGTVYTLGNGGSAAVAMHLAADLTRLTRLPERERQMRVVPLAGNGSLLTACANDFGFEHAFAEQLRGLVGQGDVVVAISTSGASPNVLRAVEYARREGAITLALTGQSGSRLRGAVDEALVIPSSDVQIIEDAAMVSAHLLCLLSYRRRLMDGD